MNHAENEELEIDLLELLNFFRSRWILIAGVFVAAALVAGTFTYFGITPKYKATTKLYMVSASEDSVINLNDLNLGTGLSKDYEELIKIRPIFEDVIEDEKLPYSYDQLMGMTTVSVIGDTRILCITVEDADPKEAAEVANALAKKAVEYLPKVMESAAPNIAEEAIVPTGKSSPSLTKNTMMGGVLALIVVLGILTVIFLLDDTVKTAEDMEKIFGIMPMTVIPEGDLTEKKEEEQEV